MDFSFDVPGGVTGRYHDPVEVLGRNLFPEMCFQVVNVSIKVSLELLLGELQVDAASADDSESGRSALAGGLQFDPLGLHHVSPVCGVDGHPLLTE